MESDRVIGKDNKWDIGMIIVPRVDEGKDAFNAMVAAVNSVDERVKSFTGEQQRAIDRVDKKRILKFKNYICLGISSFCYWTQASYFT